MSSNDEKRTLPTLKTQQDWKKEFPFLVFSSTSMTCKLCTKFDSKIMGCKIYNPSFVNGSTNFRKSAVKDHANTMMHFEAVKLDKIQKAKEVGEKYVTKRTPTGSTKTGESFKKSGSMTDAQKECFEKLFHVAYSVAKRGRPYTDFTDIIELEKLHNVKFFPGSYENESVRRDFLNSCANLIFNEEVKEKLLKTNFINILCDGSTDSSVIEKKCIYVQFVEPSSMKINVALLSLQDLPSQDASGIYEAIKKAFTEVGLETCLDNIVFLASDGAAVNTGLKNGLIKLIRDDRPFVWCLAQKLELGIKDALSDWIKPVEVNLQYLYYMYEKSSKKPRELKELFSILTEVYVFENQEVKPHRATCTRWIAQKLKSLKNYTDKFGLYIHNIENILADATKKTDKATLEGKYRLLVNTKTFLLSCLLVDLLEPARNLSLETQKDENNLIKTMSVIEVKKNRYQRLKNQLSKDSKLIFEFLCLEKSPVGNKFSTRKILLSKY